MRGREVVTPRLNAGVLACAGGIKAEPRWGKGAEMLRRLTSWRFGVLLGVTLLDALIFTVPITALGLVVLAVVAPQFLRRAAAFLQALADGR
jgi:hypothetical protein